MDFLNLINSRYSERGYTDRKVSNDDLNYILECAILAPSAANRQPWRVYVVTNPHIKQKLYESYTRDWFLSAPVHLVFTGFPETSWKRADDTDYLLCDVTLFAHHLVLAATERGLATCYIAAFDPLKVRSALHLPNEEIPFLMTPLGYAKEGCRRERKRNPFHESVKFLY